LSQSNLRPWPKGVSGNPAGTVKLPPELRQARRDNMQQLIQLIHLYVGMTEDQAKVRLNGPDSLQIEEMIQGQINKSKEGDPRAFQFIIEVMCGKIPESDENVASDSLTPQQKLEYMKRAVAVMEAQIESRPLPEPT
jgi:hypothetical protein